jgi:hypothetical protein
MKIRPTNGKTKRTTGLKACLRTLHFAHTHTLHLWISYDSHNSLTSASFFKQRKISNLYDGDPVFSVR